MISCCCCCSNAAIMELNRNVKQRKRKQKTFLLFRCLPFLNRSITVIDWRFVVSRLLSDNRKLLVRKVRPVISLALLNYSVDAECEFIFGWDTPAVYPDHYCCSQRLLGAACVWKGFIVWVTLLLLESNLLRTERLVMGRLREFSLITIELLSWWFVEDVTLLLR